jgi:hypothetical protein
MTYGINQPLGAVATTYGGSSNWNGGFQQFQITPATTALFTGDPVVFTNGLLAIYTAGNAAGPLAGIFIGCEYTDPTGTVQFSKYWPNNQAVMTGTIALANVIVDPNTYFTIQANNAVTTANLNHNADFVAGNGNTATGYSGYMLDTTTIATTSTLPLHIVAFDPTPGNISGLTYNNVIVKLNDTTINAGATGH